MITILLAACNGEKYIAEQIESILDQTYGNWTLVVQDDCSEDKTCEIVEKYAGRYADRIILKKRNTSSPNKGIRPRRNCNNQLNML